jgi:hypothetical protein
MAALFACLLDGQPAFAQREPVIVVPGRPGYVPILWGQDISGAVIEGEFGLDRPGFPKTVIPPRLVYSFDMGSARGRYFPSTGEKPAFGRLEVIPPANRELPKPAESYERSWSSESPRTSPNVEQEVPFNPPPILYAPNIVEPPNRPRPRPR